MTDHYRFDVVWKGKWYRLASLSEHIKARLVHGPVWLLIDELYRTYKAPREEVHIPAKPVNWPQKKR